MEASSKNQKVSSLNSIDILNDAIEYIVHASLSYRICGYVGIVDDICGREF
jgi:hypothetical protein